MIFDIYETRKGMARQTIYHRVEADSEEEALRLVNESDKYAHDWYEVEFIGNYSNQISTFEIDGPPRFEDEDEQEG